MMTRRFNRADLVWVNENWDASKRIGPRGHFGLVIDQPDYDAEVIAVWNTNHRYVATPQPHQLVFISRVADD